MLRRECTTKVLSALSRHASIGLLGPRQVGKTTLAIGIAEDRPSTYLDLESAADRAKLSEPRLYLDQHQDKLIILDEIQHLPDLFAELRGWLDHQRREGRPTGRLLILGSASPDLLRQSAESLAGRIAYIELAPISALEVDPSIAAQEELWTRGGFPESLLAADPPTSSGWREAFLRTYLERDIPSFGFRVPSETLRRFWIMLAHSQGSPFNASKLGQALGVRGQTANHYLDLLVDLLLVRRLQPWVANTKKRMVRTPKVYIRDSGLLHSLLGLRTAEHVLSHPIAGSSWEGFAIENLIEAAPNGSDAYFYRSSGGAEIDLLLTLPGAQRPWAIECKRSLDPRPTRGFHSACQDVQPERKFVIYPGTERYPIKADVEAINLADAMRELSKIDSH